MLLRQLRHLMMRSGSVLTLFPSGVGDLICLAMRIRTGWRQSDSCFPKLGAEVSAIRKPPQFRERTL